MFGTGLTLLTLCFAAACAPLQPERVIEPDPDRPLEAGELGPYGVERYRWTQTVRLTEQMDLEVQLPVPPDGEPETHPVLVFVHGGAVSEQRYRWLTEHAASRGYLVIAPSHPLDIAFFAQDNPGVALRELRFRALEPDSPFFERLDPFAEAAITGHSLGAVAATWTWAAQPDDFAGVALLASFPGDASHVGTNPGDLALSLTGSTDGLATVDEVTEGFESLSSPRLLAVVQGMNHFAWVDDATAAELGRDGPQERDLSVTRAEAMEVFDTWLDATLTDDPLATTRFADGAFPDVEVTR